MPRKYTCFVCGPTEKSICRFPKEKARLEKWCSFCMISPDELPHSSRLCIEHFRESDIKILPSNRPSLDTFAIPSVYTPNQLKRLKLSPRVKNSIEKQKNSEVQLKTSIVSHTKSVLSENAVHQNAKDVENTLSVSNKVVLPNETIPMDLEPCSSNQRPPIEIEVDEVSWMGNTPSDSTEINPVDLCNNYALKNVETTCIEASDCTPEVQIQLHSPTTNVIADSPPSDPPQPLSPIIEKAVDIEPINELQVTPTIKIISNQARSRSLRYIADITTPDLETPRRRTECLKVIRYESKETKSKMRLLQQQNQRLKVKVKKLKALVLELQHQNSSAVDGSAHILVDDSDDSED